MAAFLHSLQKKTNIAAKSETGFSRHITIPVNALYHRYFRRMAFPKFDDSTVHLDGSTPQGATYRKYVALCALLI